MEPTKPVGSIISVSRVFGVVVNELQKPFYGLLLGYVLEHTLLAFVKRNLPASGTNVAVVGIGHLARTVDDAAHDAYLQSYQMAGGRLDALDGVLKVVERTATAGTVLVNFTRAACRRASPNPSKRRGE